MPAPTVPATPWLHSAFYRFVPIADPLAAADLLRRLALGLQGSLVLASEGISAALAGTPHQIASFERALQQPTLLDGSLAGMAFKHSACTTAPFGRLKVSVKPELVALGLKDGAAGADQGAACADLSAARADLSAARADLNAAHAPRDHPGSHAIDERDASHLSPQAWRTLMAQGDAVLLDNRNHFEFRLGHFRGALDPQVHHFRDFMAFVQTHAPAWRAAGRPVAMYCTGGIRCDKTAPWLRSLGLQVWQLDGGVLNYFQHMDEAERGAPDPWQGECFVFDKRIALDTRLQETATSAAQVYDPAHADEAWRLQRARRLDAAEPL